MDLISQAEAIRNVLQQQRRALDLAFIEEGHQYFMRDASSGVIRSDYPSVTALISRYYEKFDVEGVSWKMSGQDKKKQQKIKQDWAKLKAYANNQGSRVHYLLEKMIIAQYGDYKELRKPAFECDDTQIRRSDNMIQAGKDFIAIMHQRNTVLLDTEIIMGDPALGYVDQPDCVWLVENKAGTDYGIIVSDWKTNKPKNFETNHYTSKMFSPFDKVDSTALGHAYLQLPFYGRLLMKMLEGTEFAGKQFLGAIVVLLKEDGSHSEYRVPNDITQKVFALDMTRIN